MNEMMFALYLARSLFLHPRDFEKARLAALLASPRDRRPGGGRSIDHRAMDALTMYSCVIHAHQDRRSGLPIRNPINATGTAVPIIPIGVLRQSFRNCGDHIQHDNTRRCLENLNPPAEKTFVSAGRNTVRTNSQWFRRHSSEQVDIFPVAARHLTSASDIAHRPILSPQDNDSPRPLAPAEG